MKTDPPDVYRGVGFVRLGGQFSAEVWFFLLFSFFTCMLDDQLEEEKAAEELKRAAYDVRVCVWR